MIIIALPWNRKYLEDLEADYSLFDLNMKNSTQQFYLVIDGNTVTWLGQGTVEGLMSYQIISNSNMLHHYEDNRKNWGNVGFLGKYSGIEDAIKKIYPKQGYCISNMKLVPYTGQKIRGHIYHYTVIRPLVCLLGYQPSIKLENFFDQLGYRKGPQFACMGNWGNMKLFIDGKLCSSLEEWLLSFYSIALK